MSAATRNDLMEIMDNRYEQSAATIIISQLPTEQWHESIGDNYLSRRYFRSVDAQRPPDEFTRRIDAKKNEFLDLS